MEVYVHRDGQQYGPYSLDDVRTHLQSSALRREDLAWHAGLSEWQPLGQIPEVAAATAPSPAAAPPSFVPSRRDNSGASSSAASAKAPVQAAAIAAKPASQPASAPAPVSVSRSSRQRGAIPGMRAVALRNMAVGGVICFIGLVITIGGMIADAQEHHGFVLAWGAILFGGFRFIRGLAAYLKD